ncbi:hydantoinase/oxoprolinase family protein, partial [Rhodobacteraceae bacterium]|nr:hydantoinase/oxoprolinase family protein [Paracoccaceae bacterium]
VAMHTTGLGGDSEVHMQSEGLEGSLSLGPSRIVPIALAAISWPDVVLSTLESQASSKKCGEYDAKFVLPTLIKSKFNDREIILLKKIGTEAKPLDGLLSNRLELATLDRLVSRGVLMMSGITPTDASHVLGISNRWNTEASRLALKVFSNRRKGSGDVLSEGADLLAQSIIDQLTKQTGDALINVALIEDGYENNIDNTSIEDSWLINKGLQHHNNTFFINFGLRLPVIGLGASAKIYYPKVGELLSTQMIIPKHYSVANAIGAVAGRISFTCVGTVTSPSTGCFRLHGKAGPKDFSSERQALKVLTDDLSSLASKKARSSGADEIDLQVSRDIRYSNIENQRIFMEAEIAVTASGRPRITTG